MKTFTLLLPIALSAMACSAGRIVDPYKFESGIPAGQPYDVNWKQTREHPTNQKQGGLGSSASGFFPQMSTEKIGMGCGVGWKDGALHAGFDGGDPQNGVGGGFTWMPHAISSVVGVHYKDTKVNLNVTITEGNEVLFSVDGRELDWQKVLKATKEDEEENQDQRKIEREGHHLMSAEEEKTGPTGKDAGPVQKVDGKEYALGTPAYFVEPEAKDGEKFVKVHGDAKDMPIGVQPPILP